MTTPSITKCLTCKYAFQIPATCRCGSFGNYTSFFRETKRGQYSDYSPEQRLKIARYAIENGNSAAARHFSRALGKSLNEGTVRGMKASYLKQKKSTDEMMT